MLRSVRRPAGALVLSLLIAGCDSNTPTTTTPPTTTPPPTTTTPPPTPTPTPTPTPPPEPAALSALTIEPSSIQGNSSRPVGTVRLTAAAPTGGALVTLNTGDDSVAKVPASVTVAAGATTATFEIDTSTVEQASTVTIAATYSGVTQRTQLTVTAPPLVARFVITGSSAGEGSCAITDSLGTLDCQFDGSSSGGFARIWRWTMSVGSAEGTDAAGPVYNPAPGCQFLGNGSPQNGVMAATVRLVIEDRFGNRSQTASKEIAVYTGGYCGL